MLGPSPVDRPGWRNAAEIGDLGRGLFAPLQRRGRVCGGAPPRRRGGRRGFIKVNRLDGTAALYGPAPQTAFDDARPSDRAFVAVAGSASGARTTEVEKFLTREIRFDPDVWIVEIGGSCGPLVSRQCRYRLAAGIPESGGERVAAPVGLMA